MDQEKAQSVALMKYSAIAPMLNGIPEGYASYMAYCRHTAEKGVVSPDGTLRRYSENTIRKWFDLYREGGFNALVPAGRSDCGKPRRLDEGLQEEICLLRDTYPRISAVSILEKLISDGSIKPGEVSLSTITRFVRRGTSHAQESVENQMRRYERPHINEVWCGDSSAGPYLKGDGGKKRRVYIIALIDDASRFITGADAFFNDNFINLMGVMKSAVSKYGRPEMFNFDNGSAYKNKQMELLAARIGTVLHYDRPHTPVQKAKIERWYRTLKDRWMATLDMNDMDTLDKLRGSLQAFVRSYNTSPHSSLGGMAPQDRFFSEPEKIRRIPQDDIEKHFMLETERKVSADSVVVIDNTEYEVDGRFAKLRVRIRYTPDMGKMFVVEGDGTLTPLRILNKTENAVSKREKVYLHKGAL